MGICLLAMLISGCAIPGYRDAGPALAQLETLAFHPLVRHEAGAQAQARQVAAHLPAAIERVESFHRRRFRAPPVVHVCGTEACFQRFIPAQARYTAAVLYDNRLLLAPRLFDREAGRLGPVLLHELSHLFMGQHLGHYTLAVPVWFHEGLASLVAEGGGADLVSDEEAWFAAREGRHLSADEQHLPWRRTRAETWGLSISLFYRQSMLFISHLRQADPVAFERLLDLLLDGTDFDAAFAQAYHANPNRLARAFFTCTDARLDPGHPLCTQVEGVAAARVPERSSRPTAP